MCNTGTPPQICDSWQSSDTGAWSLLPHVDSLIRAYRPEPTRLSRVRAAQLTLEPLVRTLCTRGRMYQVLPGLQLPKQMQHTPPLKNNPRGLWDFVASLNHGL
jgi:hypothetical protein